MGEQIYFVEEKVDGFRGLIHKEGDSVSMFSDNKIDITSGFPTIISQAKKVSKYDIILDGELVPYDKSGKPMGRRELMSIIEAVESGNDIPKINVVLHVFDILYFNDKSTDGLKLHERKKILKTLDYTKNIKILEWTEVSTRKEMKAALEYYSSLPKSEGAIIKNVNSLYPSGQTSEWIICRGE